MTRYILFTFVLFLFHQFVASGQNGISISTTTEKLQKQYKEISQLTREGKTKKALDKCEKLIQKNPNVVELWIKKASIHFNNENYALSEESFQKVVDLSPLFDEKVYYTMAITQYAQDKYALAAENFQKFLDLNLEPGGRKIKAEKLVQDCTFAAEAVKNPLPFEPQLLGDIINTSYSEYYPVFTLDQRRVVFTRLIGGQEDFYFCEIKDSVFTYCDEMYELNTPLSEGVHCLAPDGNMIIYTTCHSKESFGSCDLFFSVYREGRWSQPINLGENINGPTWDSQPTLSGDGQELYFASKRTGGYGGSDIYVSKRDDKGKWSVAQNLGPLINTSGNEESPFIHPDHQTLYFRSDGLPGMGDYDIYLTNRNLKDRQWSLPKNIGYPINTKYNDGAMTVNIQGTQAYFTSDRAYAKNDPKSNLDIYSFDLDPSIAPIPSTYVEINVIDQDTGLPLVADINLVQNQAKLSVLSIKSDYLGKALFSVPLGQECALLISKKGYIYHSEHLPLQEARTANNAYQFTIALEKSKPTDTLIDNTLEPKARVLNNIFFETGSAELKSTSDVEIDYLVQMLTEEPQLKIKIIGHTDNVGSPDKNLILSNQRATSVVQSLISRGIAPSRLQNEGKGETQAIATNDTPEGRQLNRRTEFIVIR